jgi:hypothetical protein
MSRRAKENTRKRNRRILWISILVGVAMLAVVLILIVELSTPPSSPFIGKVVPPSVLSTITGVSDSTLAAVGAGPPGSPPPVAVPSPISGSPLTSNGKPEVLYIGGDYCPFCAVERWSMIMALSKFGTFSNIQYMQSSATDTNPNTPTFTFESSNYTSPYISFVPVEQFGRGGSTDVRQPLTQDQQALVSQYDSPGSIPFIDIANKYVVVGAQFTLNIAGQNWTAIASQLNNPSSSVAQLVDGAANTLTSAICKADGGQPSSVCGQSYATLTLAFAGTGPAPVQPAVAVTSTRREPLRWTD